MDTPQGTQGTPGKPTDPCAKLQALQGEIALLEGKKQVVASLQAMCADLDKAQGSLEGYGNRLEDLTTDQSSKIDLVADYLDDDTKQEIKTLAGAYIDSLTAARDKAASAKQAYDQAVILRGQRQADLQSAKDALALVKAKLPAFDSALKDGESLDKKIDGFIQRPSRGEAYAALLVLEDSLTQINGLLDLDKYAGQLKAAVTKVLEMDTARITAEADAAAKKADLAKAQADVAKIPATELPKLLADARAAATAPTAGTTVKPPMARGA